MMYTDISVDDSLLYNNRPTSARSPRSQVRTTVTDPPRPLSSGLPNTYKLRNDTSTGLDSPSTFRTLSEDRGDTTSPRPLSSCLSNTSKLRNNTSASLDSPSFRDKKQVSFRLDKNSGEIHKSTSLLETEYDSTVYDQIERQHQLAKHTKHVMDINKRLNLVRSRSTEFKSTPNLNFTRPTVGFR